MTTRPRLKEFRIEDSRDGIVHLVFDMPGRSMNVFSNSAIDDIGVFAAWLKQSDARGCVVRSGKSNAFCAGADLPEIEAAYDMIEAAPPAERVKIAFDHFFRLSRNFRALETSGKPVAAAIDGLALGGGCELALACHFRVMTSGGKSQLGLPESLVGLLPGAGGTQRLPRLVDIDTALNVLLDGGKLDAQQALLYGAVGEIVAPGDDITAAERWILSEGETRQPWDRPKAPRLDFNAVQSRLGQERKTRLAQTFGHYPAPLAILDCLERGLAAPMELALAAEMDVFSHLIQRPEPRAMIRTLFMGKLDFDRQKAKGALPAQLPIVLDHALKGLEKSEAAARQSGADEMTIIRAQAFAGFTLSTGTKPFAKDAPQPSADETYWFEQPLSDPIACLAAELLFSVARAVAPDVDGLEPAQANVIDYAACRQLGFPSYVGGPLALARRIARNTAPAA